MEESLEIISKDFEEVDSVDIKDDKVQRDVVYEKIEECLELQKSISNLKNKQEIQEKQDSLKKVSAFLLDLQTKNLIPSPTELIAEEVAHVEPKNKQEEAENIIAKVKKLVEMSKRESKMNQDVAVLDIPQEIKDIRNLFFVTKSPACIEIPSNLKIYDVLKLFRESSVFESIGHFIEMGGHFEEGKDEVWLVIGNYNGASFGIEQDIEYPFDYNYPPKRRFFNSSEQKILKNPIFFHTHPLNRISFSATDLQPKFVMDDVKEFFVERHLVVSETVDTGESTYNFLTRIYDPKNPLFYKIYNDVISDTALKMTDDSWGKYLFSEKIIEDILNRSNMSKLDDVEIKKNYFEKLSGY